MKLAVLDQTRAHGAELGPWRGMDADAAQLARALGHPFGARHAPTVRFHTVVASTPERLPLPSEHAPHWNEDVPGALELAAADAELATGRAIHAYVFNGDGDCVRHYLILPLGELGAWL